MAGILCMASKTDFWDKGKIQLFFFFFKERNFHFLRWFFHPGKDILYIPKGGDAGSPNNEEINKQMPGITSKESKVKQTTLFSSLY